MHRCEAILSFLVLLSCANMARAQSLTQLQEKAFTCDGNSGFCAEVWDHTNYEGDYIGHDEVTLGFYSSRPGSGNRAIYNLILPKDPPTAPSQDGTGGTFNSQLRIAFWLGMVLCDNQSAPEFTHSPCTPDSDANIFDNPSSAAPGFIGKHPGAAFMELQFYPPGWVASPDPTRWAVALNIFSFQEDMNHLVFNNADCLERVGAEPRNFAFITKSGKPVGPPDPFNQGFATSADVLFMNPGDRIVVIMNDTSAGLRVEITDLTTGQGGFMTASDADGFAQVVFDPSSTSCSEVPYTFYPMFSTSSEHTRAAWIPYLVNIAYADEIGHFEYCNAASAPFGNCASAGVNDPGGLDADDSLCVDPSQAASFGLTPIGGCLGSDFDFDGPPYQALWPGTLKDRKLDAALHPTPIRCMSPVFPDWEGLQEYDRVAFINILPTIELQSVPPCNLLTGANCVNPPPGSGFYPFFSTTKMDHQCFWQLGGEHIPKTAKDFGGSASAEFGALAPVTFPYPVGEGSISLFENFRRVLDRNPCPALAE